MKGVCSANMRAAVRASGQGRGGKLTLPEDLIAKGAVVTRMEADVLRRLEHALGGPSSRIVTHRFLVLNSLAKMVKVNGGRANCDKYLITYFSLLQAVGTWWRRVAGT